jgi:flagellar basal-body rod protein FlgB
MELAGIPLLSMLRERMSWLNQRQDMLSQNVANADTPGYVAHDLKPLNFNDVMAQQSSPLRQASMLTLTNPRHIEIQPAAMDSFQDMTVRDAESSPNGNAVGLEQEMIKVADTQAQFQAATNLYAKAMTMMKTAIGH